MGYIIFTNVDRPESEKRPKLSYDGCTGTWSTDAYGSSRLYVECANVLNRSGAAWEYMRADILRQGGSETVEEPT